VTPFNDPEGSQPTATYSQTGGGLKVKIQRPTNNTRTNARPPSSLPKKTRPKTEKTVEKPDKLEIKQEKIEKEKEKPPIIEKKPIGEPEMTGRTYELCTALIQNLMSDEKSPPFNSPVPYDKLNIPQYPLIIKHPMDLGTIKSTLLKPRGRDKYKSLKEFASKVRLVFDNARTFNQSGSPIYNDADYLSKLFESRYSDLQRTLGLPKSYDPPKEFVPPPPITAPVGIGLEPLTPPVVARRTNFKDGATAPADPKKPKRKAQPGRQQHSQRPTKKKKTSESEIKSHVSAQVATQLHDSLIQLNENEWAMGRVMEIISPNSTSSGSGEMEIDVASLSIETVRKLQRFIKEYNSNPNNPHSNPTPSGDNPSRGGMGIDEDDEDDENDPDYQ